MSDSDAVIRMRSPDWGECNLHDGGAGTATYDRAMSPLPATHNRTMSPLPGLRMTHNSLRCVPLRMLQLSTCCLRREGPSTTLVVRYRQIQFRHCSTRIPRHKPFSLRASQLALFCLERCAELDSPGGSGGSQMVVMARL